MMPKILLHTLESANKDIHNISMVDFCRRGWKPYSELKVIFYGTKEYEKIYVQTLIYKRNWLDFLSLRD